jgi:hypothetical protein
MTANNIKQQILGYLEVLPSEEVKIILLQWLSGSDGNLEDFERLLTNQSTQEIEKSFEYGDIDAELNFQHLTEVQMIQQSKSVLEDYKSKGSGVAHNLVRKWADSLGTDEELPCPR